MSDHTITSGRSLMNPDRNGALLCYGAAALALSLGVVIAALRFPGEFDWVYMVISRLGSTRHNPGGAQWLTGSLLVAVFLLLPVTGYLRRGGSADGARPRISVAALRIGLIGAGLLAIEGLTSVELSGLGRKGHEAVAILTFLGLYGGVLGVLVHRIRHAAASVWPALLVAGPLVAVGVSQVALYFDQRDLGWVNVAWREMGVPFWLSFAFWQWLAVACLLAGIGYLVAAREREAPRAAEAPAAERPDPERPAAERPDRERSDPERPRPAAGSAGP